MAKQIHKISYQVTVAYSGGVRDDADIQVSQVNYTLCDSADAEMKKHGGLHAAEGISETISAAELGVVGTEGSVLYKTNAIEDAVKTKESIA